MPPIAAIQHKKKNVRQLSMYQFIRPHLEGIIT
jgi:hypothetical protein